MKEVENKSNYGNGVTYVVKVEDNLHLDHWTWETNSSGLTDAKYDVSLSNPDAAFGSFSQTTNSDRGNMSDSISFGFNVEGKRYGIRQIVYGVKYVQNVIRADVL